MVEFPNKKSNVWMEFVPDPEGRSWFKLGRSVAIETVEYCRRHEKEIKEQIEAGVGGWADSLFDCA